ncbi:hypothetical protein [Chromobacterium alticapitis]|uniref:Uncharacterized protein n=1 Tax=Chromobacterium alticapitis TaxID=2073169 RepID=A0A2S5DL48_9NEIS|nr:hypothetical protein [Chromobacterium alticapitis]POZ63766.1 hypothetical protein C2I19_01560 [Chromobacterium alticapitis]
MAKEQNTLRAALAVSALSVEERRWLESRLSDEQRGQLAQALASLDQRPLLEQADALERPSDAGPRPAALLQAMHDEPAWMQAAIGRALGEAWREALSLELDGADAWRERADGLRREWAAGDRRAAPALRACLLAGLEAKAAAMPMIEPGPVVVAEADRGWPRMKRWFARRRHE